MKFSFDWLKRYLDTSLTPEEVADGLTSIGLEVEGCGNEYGYLNDFVVAEIISAEKHPNADKLKVCKVFDGTNTYTVVCGAPNARAAIKVALALPGVIVPSTGERLKKGAIRGIESCGMMCSSAELNISNNHEGIIELDPTSKLGDGVGNALKIVDTIFDVSVTPNRSDCFGVIGIARDAAAKGLGTFKSPQFQNVTQTIENNIEVIFESENVQKYCPAIATILLRGVTNVESPAWLKKLLASAGMKSISAIVDVTNFINMDLCRPLHAYDVENVSCMSIRFAKNGEKMLDLKGTLHQMTDEMIVSSLNTSNEPACLIGIIGGSNSGSEVTTKDVLIEAAILDPKYVAKIGQKLNINTESRTRFERGIDASITVQALQMAASTIVEICGGQISDVKISGKIPYEKKVIPFSCAFFEKISGICINESVIREILKKLGFSIDSDFNVTVPSYRHDIAIKEDLVEEIIRIYGYDRLSEQMLQYKTPPSLDVVYAKNKILGAIGRKLCYLGLDEAMNYSFISTKLANLFGELSQYVEIANPISSEMSHLRRSLIPAIATSYGQILNKSDSINGLFEIGNIFNSINEQTLSVAGLRGGIFKEKNWMEPAVNTSSYHSKSDLFAILDIFSIDETKTQIVQKNLPKYYHEGNSGAVYLGNKLLGYFGELHPFVTDELNIKGGVFIFECKIEELINIKQRNRSFCEKKNHDIFRDFAFLADKCIEIITFIKVIKKADKSIKNVVLFDVYDVDNLQDGKHSLAVRVTIVQNEKTMNDSEIRSVSNSIIAAITAAGGEIRK